MSSIKMFRNARNTSGRNSRNTSGRNSRDTSGRNSRNTSGRNSRDTSGRNSRNTSGRNSRNTSGRNFPAVFAFRAFVMFRACATDTKLNFTLDHNSCIRRIYCILCVRFALFVLIFPSIFR